MYFDTIASIVQSIGLMAVSYMLFYRVGKKIASLELEVRTLKAKFHPPAHVPVLEKNFVERREKLPRMIVLRDYPK